MIVKKIVNLFMEGSPISAWALFFGALWIHSYTMIASLIRTRLSVLCARREVGTFGEETFVPQH